MATASTISVSQTVIHPSELVWRALRWGVAGGGYTAEHSCYVEGCTTPLGINFNQLLTCLHAPSGIDNGGSCCPSSSGYASDWCTLLSDWQ